MLNKNEIITNKIEKKGVVREIRITSEKVVITTSSEKGIEEKTYQYTMHNYSIEGIFSIMTYELGIIVFSIKLCKPIILKPKVLNIGFYQVGGENFIKLYDEYEQEIYDAEGRLL